MIRALVLSAALIPAAQAVMSSCDPPPPAPTTVEAICTNGGFTFTYTGTEAAMPPRCTVVAEHQASSTSVTAP